MAEAQLVVDGIEVFIEGDGPQTVVMIHGWPDTWRLWQGTVDRLKGQCRCVRFSLPGFDVTKPPRPVSLDQMVALFKAIVDAMSPGQPVVLLTHDWGAIFGYEFAHRHPDRVGRIIAVDIGDISTSAYLKSLSFKAKLMVAGYQLWLALAWKLGGRLGDRMSRYMARLLRCRTDPALIGGQMNYPYYTLWTGAFGGYRPGLSRFEPHCPVLYIYGRRKPFQFQSARWLEQVAALPGGQVRPFETGHWVMVSDPQGFNDCVAGWLELARRG